MLLDYNCDQTYLNSAIENKLNLILFENNNIKELYTQLDVFEQSIIYFINEFVQNQGRNELIQKDIIRRQEFINKLKNITSQIQDYPITNEIDVTISTYEFVLDGQMWLLSDYINCISDNFIMGGEQIRKSKITDQKISNLIKRPRLKKL